nr:transcription factor SOX-9-like isoform X1 [Leptinotarsa decemlineata]
MPDNLMNCCIKKETEERVAEYNKQISLKPRIPRPPNAFMIYANENRKIMSQQFPADSNKEISKKLGSTWKNLNPEEKMKYFDKARAVDMEHKRKYPDYVYNPKEARIRKAMREASRDRSIGGSPMLPRPNARRPPPHGWVPPGAAHEELMMTPLPAGMSGSSGLDAPCFPMPSSSGTGTNQFMPTMNSGYSTKLHQDAPLPPPTTDPSVHSNYMQPNPLSQLQQQTEMWHNFQDDLRPRSSGNPYMMQDIPPSPYHHQPSPPLSVPSPLMMDKHRQTPHPIHSMSNTSMPITPPHSNSNMSMTPPHSNENIPPDESTQISVGKMFAEDGCLETRPVTELPHPLMENNVQQHPEFMPMYGQEGAAAAQQQYSQQQQHQHQQPQQRQFNHQQQSHSQRQPRQQRQNFDRVEEMQMKRPAVSSPAAAPIRAASALSKKPSPKPLPDFNEAFGSTERGRFQSPPDPRLVPNEGLLDLFYEDGPQMKFEDFQM